MEELQDRYHESESLSEATEDKAYWYQVSKPESIPDTSNLRPEIGLLIRKGVSLQL